jgi:amino acid transporter
VDRVFNLRSLSEHKWESAERFKKTQRTWDKWGLALFIIGLIVMVLYIVIAAILIATGNAQLQ